MSEAKAIVAKKIRPVEGIRKTPLKSNVRRFANSPRNLRLINKHLAKGEEPKRFIASKASCELIQSICEREIIKIFKIASLSHKANRKQIVPLYDYKFASLISRKPDPDTWSRTDMIDLSLSRQKKTIHSELEFTSEADLINSKNWRDEHDVNVALTELNEINQLRDKTISIQRKIPVEKQKRTAYIQSGYTDEDYQIEPYYKNKTINKTSSKNYRDMKAIDEKVKRKQLKTKKKVSSSKKNKVNKTKQTKDK